MRAQRSIPEPLGPDGVRVLSRDLSESAFSELVAAGRVAWDIETNGLEPEGSSIGTCQLYAPGAGAFVVKGLAGERPELLSALLADASVVKVFHHAPFDLSFMVHAWGVKPESIRCTKIAAKLLAPQAPAEMYSLKHLMFHHFGIHLDKSVRFTDWTSNSLTSRQLAYAFGDVERLLDLYDILSGALRDRDLMDLYSEACGFLSTHVSLRLHGCPDPYSY